MIKLAGTWTFTQGSQAAVGVDTAALTAIFVGDAISRDRINWYRVLTITNDTNITFEPAFSEGTSGQVFTLQQGWLLPVSTTRPYAGAVTAQFTDIRQRYSEFIVHGSDRRITLNKANSTDNSEIIHQTAGVNKFKSGLIADNEWALMAFINGAWANVLKTVTTGVSPSQAVSLSYNLAIGVGVGTVSLPGMAFVGRTDTGLWSPAAATLAASAGGVEPWRSTATLFTLNVNTKLSKASPTFDINKAAAGQATLLRSYTNDVLTWQFDLGDATAHAGGNVGSDVYFRAYSDAGASIGNALAITRSSMLATFGGGISATGNVNPLSSNGAALGTTALMWSDLFLATGAVINFNNGNATLTHSAGLLTAATNIQIKGDVAGASNGWGAAQLLVTGVTDVNKRIAIGYATTENVGFIQPYINGGAYQDLLLNPAGGNVGIGLATAPGARLHVAGTVIATGIVSLTAATPSTSTTTGALTIGGGLGVAGAGYFGGVVQGTAFQVGGTQVMGARDTGWAAMTGTANEGAVYDTATVTLAQLAGRVMALQAALTTHGAIGA